MIKVIIVDDSPVVRSLLQEILSSDPDINVVASAADPYEAREKIKQFNPDVITLDIEMPKMDGVTFLRNLMRLRPMPVIMISSLTERGADVTLDCLEIGAIDYIEKPKANLNDELRNYSNLIIEKVKAAASVTRTVLEKKEIKPPEPTAKSSAKASLAKVDLIAVGASTGGTEAIKNFLQSAPYPLPPIVIVQHIPPKFSASFANRLDKLLPFTVKEVQSDSMRLIPGHVYIAPGDRHMSIQKVQSGYLTKLEDGEPVNRHKPAVDVLFDSVSKYVGKAAIGILLTGMGDDGAKGLLRMRESGAFTIAQDKDSSIVWGMPGSAVALNAAVKVAPLLKIAGEITRFLEGEKVC